MFFKNILDKKLAQWGKAKQVLPPNASMMKERFLSSATLPHNPLKHVRPPRFYFKILSVGLAALVLFVGVHEYRKNSRDMSSGSYGGGYSSDGLVPPRGQTEYNESADPLAIRLGEATPLSQSAGVAGIVDTVTERAKSIAREFVQPEYYPYNPSTPITDDREFLKYSYNANLQTRDVEEVSTKILTIVRGYKGRVDSARINDNYSNISFVIPKDDLFSFRAEVKALVGKRFYQENLYLQNLLPEKVAIEESTEVVSKNLVDLQDKLKEFTEKHNRTITGLQRDLGSVNGRIAKLNAEVTTDPERQKQIKAEVATLTVRQGVLQRQIISENSRYNFDKASMEQYIKSTQAKLDNLSKQDKDLDEYVETVQGNINIQWMSIHEMLDIYVPYYWVWIIGLCILGLIARSLTKRRTIEAW